MMKKAVLRYHNGDTIKGYVKDFSPVKDRVIVKDHDSENVHVVNIDELKAIFFVRFFIGDQNYQEKKVYGIRRPRGKRVFIKFTDGESLVGFLEGDVPWEHGFFLSRMDENLKGFFLIPVDQESNNEKVFVIASSVKDVTVVP
jgi:hypothetical protein